MHPIMKTTAYAILTSLAFLAVSILSMPATSTAADSTQITIYVFSGAEKIMGPDGKPHDTVVPSNFVVKAGQPVTTNFAEYLLPTAPAFPMFETRYMQTPSPLNPLGAKGAGEVSTIPTAAAVIAAIEDALAPFAVHIAQTPVTPQKLVELIGHGIRSGACLDTA